MKVKRMKVGDRTDLLLPPDSKERLKSRLATKVYLPEFIMAKYFPRSERALHTVRLSLYRTAEGIIGMEIVPLKDDEGLLVPPPLYKVPRLRHANRWAIKGEAKKNDSIKL